MKHHNLLFIPVLSLSVISPAVFSQENELDITIRVMDENEQPSDFVQRLELPPPENFGITPQSETSDSLTLEEEVSGISDDITGIANASEDISINTIIDNISINGAGTESTVDNAGNLPNQVVDILDEDLPLNTDLSDNVDEATGVIVDVTDDLVDDGVGDLTGEITDETGDTGDDIADNVSEATDDVSGDIVDTVDDLDSPAEGVEDTLDTFSDAGETGNLTTELDEFSQPLEQPIEEDSLGIPQDLSDGL